MPEYLDYTWVSWVEKLPTEKPASPIVALTESSSSTPPGIPTMQIFDDTGKLITRVVLLADAVYRDDK